MRILSVGRSRPQSDPVCHALSVRSVSENPVFAGFCPPKKKGLVAQAFHSFENFLVVMGRIELPTYGL